jgi:nucleoside-diphosphate-sugar epimerase
MKRLYSTGSTGTIGKHLPTSAHSLKFDLSRGREWFYGINFETQSNLIHLAGVVGPQDVLKDVNYARSVNISGTQFLAEEFFKKSEGTFYFISTSHVYAPSLDLISESNELAPGNIYAEQKLEAEYLLQSIFAPSPERLCIIRVFSVLDWDVAPFTLGGGIRKLADIDSGFVLSNASDVRDFLTPKDIAGAIFEIASTGTHFDIVNLCTGIGTSVGNAAKKMLSESGFVVPNEKISWGRSSNPLVVGNNSLLISRQPTLDLSWKPSALN